MYRPSLTAVTHTATTNRMVSPPRRRSQIPALSSSTFASDTINTNSGGCGGLGEEVGVVDEEEEEEVAEGTTASSHESHDIFSLLHWLPARAVCPRRACR